MSFNEKKPFTLSVEVTKDDWKAAKAARKAANEDPIGPMFNVCVQCAAGRAINRALSAMFPGDETIYATCASGTCQIRRDKVGASASVLGKSIMGLDGCIPITPHLTEVVEAFDGRYENEPTPSFSLHFVPNDIEDR